MVQGHGRFAYANDNADEDGEAGNHQSAMAVAQGHIRNQCGVFQLPQARLQAADQ